MSRKNTISVAYALRNESGNILKSLGSIYDFSNEIIIVDGSSTDDTVSKIKDFDKDKKVKIYVEPHVEMFHINKQKAIEKCTRDWILQLDADEIVTKDLEKEILENIEENRYIAFNIPRLNYFLGRPLKKGGQYPDHTIRLYKNGVARFPCKSVHEQVDIKVKENDSKKSNYISYLKSPLLHYPYPIFKDYLDKWHRYNKLEAEKLKQENFSMNFINSFKYLFLYPFYWFIKVYFRHLGFLDGYAGFVFSFFTAIRFLGIWREYRN